MNTLDALDQLDAINAKLDTLLFAIPALVAAVVVAVSVSTKQYNNDNGK